MIGAATVDALVAAIPAGAVVRREAKANTLRAPP